MKSLFGLPEKVLFCKNCVISNQRPRSTVEFAHKKDDIKLTIGFGVDGVCDACHYSIIKSTTIDWLKREEQLVDLLDRHRRGSGHDVIVPGSGGKDSAYTAHVLKYRYGMNPLTVTWAPHKYTEIGWKNFESWSHVGGVDNILFTPNGRLHRFLTRTAFLNLLHPFQPFILGQRLIGPLLAAKFNVPLVMYGENQAEYGNDPVENSAPTMNPSFFSSNSPENCVFGGRTLRDLLLECNFNLKDFTPYLPPDPGYLSSKNVEVHYLGYYHKWDPQECYYYAVENTGFRPNDQRTEGTYSKYSSIDDRLDMFHYYTTLVKFGIGRATYDAAQEIRNQKITREEGVNLVRRYDQEFPKKYLQDFLDYISLTEDEFHVITDKFRSPHLWERQNGDWKLKHPVWNSNCE